MSSERALRLSPAENWPMAGIRQTSRFHFVKPEDLREPSPPDLLGS